MEQFNLMMVTTLRPELLKRTLDSFSKNLFGDHIRKANLIINIDRTGCPEDQETDKINEIIEYIDSFNFNDAKINIPEEPSFSRAFYWCLGQLDSPITFYLEEDWELLRPVDFELMVEEMVNSDDLAHLRLSAFKSDTKKIKTWNKFCNWNGYYYEVPRTIRGTIGWCGHPGLTRTSFLLFFRTIIDPERNPEKQIKGSFPIIINSRFGIWQEQKSGPSIRDIGRAWMVQNGWQKKGNKAHFTVWERAEE